MTHKSVDGNDMSSYGDFSAKRDLWREEYNMLEKEVADLQAELAGENDDFNNHE